jgi:hypothetical protein
VTTLIDCPICKNYIRGVGGKCKAFPDGIPEAILSGDEVHTEPYPGDNGIQFEPSDKALADPRSLYKPVSQ